ncbi:hypothetical protein AB0A69_04465 [Streptomyces sp. NPDC045431]|uniref:hypothetical protein n=1 Tax=Streptomyces sp. NPDC045431 TaxID=3155613 RepID=UPI0033FA2740
MKTETGTPAVIAKNRLVSSTVEGNAKKTDELKDLGVPHLKAALAARGADAVLSGTSVK